MLKSMNEEEEKESEEVDGLVKWRRLDMPGTSREWRMWGRIASIPNAMGCIASSLWQ